LVEGKEEGRFSFYNHMRGKHKFRVGAWIEKQERENQTRAHEQDLMQIL
jgi:hypothetical protein